MVITHDTHAVTIGSLNSRYENDGGWLSLKMLGGIGRFFIDEDQYGDPERSHATESAAVLTCTSE